MAVVLTRNLKQTSYTFVVWPSNKVFTPSMQLNLNKCILYKIYKYKTFIPVSTYTQSRKGKTQILHWSVSLKLTDINLNYCKKTSQRWPVSIHGLSNKLLNTRSIPSTRFIINGSRYNKDLSKGEWSRRPSQGWVKKPTLLLPHLVCQQSYFITLFSRISYSIIIIVLLSIVDSQIAKLSFRQ